MTDKSCLDACQASFQITVNRLNEVLLDALVQADGDENLEKRARENFERGLGFARKMRDICVSSCNS
jgi:hypothetical protein